MNIVDAFCWVGPHIKREPGTLYLMDELLAEHARMQIQYRLCFHHESREGVPAEGNAALTPQAGTAIGWVVASWANSELYHALEDARLPLMLEIGQVNYGEVYDLARARPDRFLGYCYVNPNYPEFLAGEMDRCFDRFGFAVLKLHTAWNGYPYDGDRYAPVYEFANARQLPILAHCWGDDSVRQFVRMARKYPLTKCLVAHTGAGNATINYEEAKRTPNLFLELAYSAGTPWDVERTVCEVGAERVVWGSDTALFPASHQIGKVIYANLPDADKSLILGGNAKRIFGLS